MRNKVLYILPSKEIGGTEKMLVMLATGMKKYNFEPVVLTLQQEGPFHRMLDASGIKRYALNAKRNPLYAIIKIIFVFLKENPCIVHSFLFGGNISAKFLRLFFWKPLVCSIRSTDDWKKPFHWKIEKFTDFLCSLIISNSSAGKKAFIEKAGLSAKKIKVIPNGIDIGKIKEKFQYIKKTPHTGVIAGSVGNLRKAKGYDVLIDAADIVRKKRNDVHFIILGKGPLEQHLKEKIQKLNLTESVKLYGFAEDVYNYMADFDIVVIPSLWEGFPVVALEAMACGKPVVATKVGDLPEIVEHGKTGILVAPGKPEELADAILKMASGPDMRKEMGKEASIKAEKFSLDNMVREYCRTYELLLKKHETETMIKSS